jgi:hypothetical protein
MNIDRERGSAAAFRSSSAAARWVLHPVPATQLTSGLEATRLGHVAGGGLGRRRSLAPVLRHAHGGGQRVASLPGSADTRPLMPGLSRGGIVCCVTRS